MRSPLRPSLAVALAVVASQLALPRPARAEQSHVTLQRLPAERLRALGPVLRRFDVVLVESDAQGKQKQITCITLVAAAPAAVREVVAHPEHYTEFVRNLSKSDVTPLGPGAAEQHYALSYGIFSTDGRNRFEFPPATAELPVAPVEILDVTGIGRYRWEFHPADSGGGTVVVLYGYTDVRHSGGIIGKIINRNESLEYGLSVMTSLTMLLSVKPRSELHPGAFAPLSPPPSSGLSSPNLDFLVERGSVALMISERGRLERLSLIERSTAPASALLAAASHPAEWSRYVPSVEASGVAAPAHELAAAHVKRSLPLMSWETRYAINTRGPGVGLYGVEGNLAGSQLQWDTRPDAGGTTRLTLRTVEHYNASNIVMRQLYGLEPLLEYGVNVGMGLVLLRGVRSEAERGH